MYVRVKAHPKSREEKVVRLSRDHFEIWVKEPAERNQANRRICALLAAEFGAPPQAARIVTGHRSPAKILDVLV